MQRFLAYAWLVFSALWIRGGIAFFRELLTASGTGAGGLIVASPLAALAILCVVVGVIIGFFLGGGSRAARRAAVIMSVLGLVVTVIAVPVAIFAMIGLFVIVEAGYVLSAIALVLTPVLFVLTLAGVWSDPAPLVVNRRRFFGLGLVIVATAFLPNWKWEPAPSDPEEVARYEAAVKTNDVALLSRSRAWEIFPGCGDLLQCAIAERNVSSVKTLLAHRPMSRSLELYRDAALGLGDEAILQALADAGADFKEDGAVRSALYTRSLPSLRFVLSHGASAQRAWCLLDAIVAYEEAEKKPLRDVLLSAGADPKGCR